MKMTPDDWAGKSLKEKYVLSVNLRSIKGESPSSKADEKRDKLEFLLITCLHFFSFLYLPMELISPRSLTVK